MEIRDWDVKTDGEIPKISFSRKDFTPTKAVRIENEAGVWYGLSDGKTNIRIALLVKSQARQDADAAAAVESKKTFDALTAHRAAIDTFTAKVNVAQSNDAEWAKLTPDEKVERTRIVQLGLLGLQTSNADLVAKAVDALPAVAASADVIADVGPALEVKP